MRRQISAAVITLALVPAVMAGLAGCSSSESPEAGKTPVGSYDWDLDFASCMREKGNDYADPKPGDDSGVQQNRVPDPEKNQADSNACTESVTAKRGDRPVSEERRKELDDFNAGYQKMADCLGKKGYEVKLVDGGMIPQEEIPDEAYESCSDGSEIQQHEVGE